MKRFVVFISLILTFCMVRLVFAEDTLLFNSTPGYLGGCQFTDKSEWELTKDLDVTKFEIWYYWNEGESTLPVTIYKDGEKFAEFTAVRGDCDIYQKQWCNADYMINKIFPKGKYSTEIKEARQCKEPGNTGTVRLYGSETVQMNNEEPTSETTLETAPEAGPEAATTTAAESNSVCIKSCASSVVISAVITLFVSFMLFSFVSRRR